MYYSRLHEIAQSYTHSALIGLPHLAHDLTLIHLTKCILTTLSNLEASGGFGVSRFFDGVARASRSLPGRRGAPKPKIVRFVSKWGMKEKGESIVEYRTTFMALFCS